jgi:hypothetical protein
VRVFGLADVTCAPEELAGEEDGDPQRAALAVS